MGVIEILNKQAREEGIQIGIERTRKEVEKTLLEKDKENEVKLVSAYLMLTQKGFSIDEIAEILGTKVAEIEKLIQKNI